MPKKESADPSFPLIGKSVTGHDVVVVGIASNSGKYVGEYRSRQSGNWSSIGWLPGSGAASPLTRSLSFPSLGLPSTPENNLLIEKHANQQKGYKASYEKLSHSMMMSDADDEPGGEDENDNGADD